MSLLILILFKSLSAFSQDQGLMEYLKKSFNVSPDSLNQVNLDPWTTSQILQRKKNDSQNIYYQIRPLTGPYEGMQYWFAASVNSTQLNYESWIGTSMKDADTAPLIINKEPILVVEQPAGSARQVIKKIDDVQNAVKLSSNTLIKPCEYSLSKFQADKLNLNVSCQYKGIRGQNLGGSLSLKIENSKVVSIQAKSKGCEINLDKFKQTSQKESSITLEDSKGCQVIIYQNINRDGSARGTYHLGMRSDVCEKTCPATQKEFWQIEIDPKAQHCE